jgi:hypothetical protein
VPISSVVNYAVTNCQTVDDLEILTFTANPLAPVIDAPTLPVTLDGSSQPILVRTTADPYVSYFNWEDATHEMVGTWTYKMKSYVFGYATNTKDDYPVM